MLNNNPTPYLDNSKRTKCEIWSRTMWYYRPISGYNIGKKSEFISRKYFNELIALNNKDFNQQYDKVETRN